MSKPMLLTKQIMQAFMQSTQERYSATACTEVSPIKFSHDAVSNYLKQSKLSPKEVFNAVKYRIEEESKYVLCVDDTVLNKNRSKKIELVTKQYSGAVHKLVNGIGVVNSFLCKDGKSYNKDKSFPIDFRIFAKEEDGKTKHDHFQEMINMALFRKINISTVVFDTWYASLKNLQFLNNLKLNWVSFLAKNRAVKISEQSKYQKLESLKIPSEGLKIYVKNFGWVKVFRFEITEGHTKYVASNQLSITWEDAKRYVKMRWNIEVYHRELKQTCGIERCQAHTGRAQRNYITLAILTWIKQSERRCVEQLSMYAQKWETMKDAIASFMKRLLFNPTLI